MDILIGATGGDDILALGAALLAVEEAIVIDFEVTVAAPIVVEADPHRCGLPLHSEREFQLWFSRTELEVSLGLMGTGKFG